MSGETSPPVRVTVAVEAPRHAALAAATGLLDYTSERTLAPGTLVRVPLGRREVAGIVWDRPPALAGAGAEVAAADATPAQAAASPATQTPTPTLKPVKAALDAMPPLSASWRALIDFAAGYYQRGVGELALAVLPPQLRQIDDTQLARRLRRLERPAPPAPPAVAAPSTSPAPPEPEPTAAGAPPTGAAGAAAQVALTADQDAALEAFALDATPALLHGVTGSGKTEVYLRAAARALQAGRQVLVLVPEINLTPQLEARFATRFPAHTLASLHSALTPAQRLRHWLLAHEGRADLVLGTRLAVFASLPRLGLIVVDEEHDASFKQQEGARYSARDLAVWRARQLGVPVLLGSATPSLETWQRVLQGRYRRLALPQRIGGGELPRVRLVDMRRLPASGPGAGSGDATPLAPPLLAALRERVERGEQSLLLLNRRGYAPVLHCPACGWKSGCPHCSAWRVFHKADRTLRCHHCGLTERVPRACPECGNLDIAPIGRGTEKLEEQLAAVLPGARIARIDADSTRGVGELARQLAAVHDGEVDVLVGTQILAKGHDFRRVTLVAAVNPDGALFTSDFRAPERLFALLMQAAGRAGRDAAQSAGSEMWIQTTSPGHALYAALVRHDYEAFAQAQLDERRAAGLPPFTHLALVRAEAREAAAATAFLRDAAVQLQALAGAADLRAYPPVPPALARVADVERVQMLVESRSRPLLQRALAAWLPGLVALRAHHRGVIRWAVDVDPLAI
ncbi:MAG: primosomal protein N' [Burkholderiales bacterium]|nr:primosomal protein N' [Burkholderiales bacterium]